MVKVGIEKLSLDASVLCEVPQRHKVLASLHHGVRDRERKGDILSGGDPTYRNLELTCKDSEQKF